MSKPTVHLEQLPYRADCCELFERLIDLPGATLLDSSYPYSQRGRFDILVADGAPLPCALPAPGDSQTSAYAAFNELARFQRERYGNISAPSEDIPFCGGIVGSLDYESGAGLNKVRTSATYTQGSIAHSYDWAVVQDHLLQRCLLVTLPGLSPARYRDVLGRLREPQRSDPKQFRLSSNFQSNMDREGYREAFERIQHYILAGDCYQVNLAQRFSARYNGSPWAAYRALRPIAGAHFGGFQVRDNGALISLSPERFLLLNGSHVETLPIKGTRPRHADAAADRLAAESLLNSDKDRSENLMIVDLLRNDLGRSCAPGSIRVDKLFELHSYPTVHHLVSTVSGELAPGRGGWELLRDSFPGGSITGAPKRRAMQIIDELEPDPREAYCGSLFYLSAHGRLDSNIAIRSLLCRDGEVHCWGGGGIVADSDWGSEYDECWDKVGKFITALEQLAA